MIIKGYPIHRKYIRIILIFWIIILFALTIFLLLMSFILERQLEKISKNCIRQLFILSNKFNLTKFMKDKAQSYFDIFIRILSNMFIFFTVLFVIGYVNIFLVFIIIPLLLVMYVHVSFNLGNDDNYQDKIRNFILLKSKEYFDIWFVLIFFTIFITLVAEYLLWNKYFHIFNYNINFIKKWIGSFFFSLIRLN